jgi:SAM-dependent methyltransferase
MRPYPDLTPSANDSRASGELLDALPCPICGGRRRTVLFSGRDRLHQIDGAFQVGRCDCGLRATTPAPLDVGRYYPQSYYAYGPPGRPPFFGYGLRGLLRTCALLYHYGYRYGPLGQRLPARGPLATALRLVTRPLRRRAALVFGPGPLPTALRGGRALDVGCGSGTWLLKMRILGWEVEGVELSEAACAAARSAGLHVHQGQLADAGLPAASFDVVRIWHTLEHVPDPALVLREAARLLRPGGLLLVGVPNAGGWLARAFGSYWFDLDVPRHLWHFTERDLRRLVEDAGLRVGHIGYGFYGAFSLLWSLRYWREERGGFTQEGRAAFEGARQQLRGARLAAPLRLLLRLAERTNHLELTATPERG